MKKIINLKNCKLKKINKGPKKKYPIQELKIGQGYFVSKKSTKISLNNVQARVYMANYLCPEKKFKTAKCKVNEEYGVLVKRIK